jgi:hypothetical protein
MKQFQLFGGEDRRHTGLSGWACFNCPPVWQLAKSLRIEGSCFCYIDTLSTRAVRAVPAHCASSWYGDSIYYFLTLNT